MDWWVSDTGLSGKTPESLRRNAAYFLQTVRNLVDRNIGQSSQFGAQHDDGSVERILSLQLSPELWHADFLGIDVLVLARWHVPIASKLVQAFRRAIRFKPPFHDEHL
jgi:hypothetical protein